MSASTSALVERLVERAGNDPAFRAHLIAEPRAAVESELGIAVPAGVTIRVVEETATEYYVVLPPAESRGQLGAGGLAGLAGGAGTGHHGRPGNPGSHPRR